MKVEKLRVNRKRLMKFTRSVLSPLTDEETLSSIMDDLSYRYDTSKKEKGTPAAFIRHCILCLMLLIPFLFQKIIGGFVMLMNYLTTAIRHLRKQKTFSIINIIGLAIGIACTILITLFIKNELSYDRFHENLNSIFRLITRIHNPDGSVRLQSTNIHIPHGPALKEYLPGIKRYIRVFHRTFIMKLGDLIENQEVILADTEFFKMFSFPLLKGHPAEVLSDISSIVISESYAKKYFREKDPVGKTLTLISGNYPNDFIVSGVAKDPPPNSTITFDLLINIESIKLFGQAEVLTDWMTLWGRCKTYVELQDHIAAETIEKRYPEFANIFYASYFERERNTKFKNAADNIAPLSFGLQWMKEVHFDPTASGSGDLTHVYILGGIVLIILFIASINFITISIGYASSRFIEVGIRKVVGAQHRQLIRQYLIESMVLTGYAFILGIAVSYLFLPVFNRLTLKSLQLSAILTPMTFVLLIFMSLFLGMFSGIYPSLVLARLHPVDIFKKKKRFGGKSYFTRFLVILQFALSIFLIISTIVLNRQIHFMANTNLGFNKDQMLIVKNIGGSMAYERLKKRLSSTPGIIEIAGAVSSPAGASSYSYITYKNKVHDFIYINYIDENYIEILDIKVLQGRNFSLEMSTDRQAVIVNESLKKTLHLSNPIGEMIEYRGTLYPVIGVITDYYNEDKRVEIPPAVHFLDPTHNFNVMLISFSPSEISKVLENTRSAWNELQPDKPFSYSFLDEDVENQYNQEKRWNRIVGYSSVMAILIACLGVFGLTSVTVCRRTKEIGIRKVCGASVFSILKLLSLESTSWVLIANLFAWPAAVYVMHKWLQNFAYKIHLSPFIFLMAALVMLLVVLVTTYTQTWKAARSNPVEALRYE